MGYLDRYQRQRKEDKQSGQTETQAKQPDSPSLLKNILNKLKWCAIRYCLAILGMLVFLYVYNAVMQRA